MATPKGRVTDSIGTGDDSFQDILVTNVSGIDPAYWPPQESGILLIRDGCVPDELVE